MSEEETAKEIKEFIYNELNFLKWDNTQNKIARFFIQTAIDKYQGVNHNEWEFWDKVRREYEKLI